MKWFACICLVLAGCANLPRETAIEESSWQALHGIDAYQTAQFRNTPGTYEVESRWAIGREPSEGTVAVFFLTVAALHLGVTDYLANNAHAWVTRSWEGVGIAWNARDISTNYAIGIR